MSLEKVFLSDMKFAKEKSWKDFFLVSVPFKRYQNMSECSII